MKTDFCENWKFYRGDLPPKRSTDGWGGAKAKAMSFGAAAETLDDSKWRSVTLPHDFVIEGDYTQNRADNGEMTQIPEMESIDSRHFAGGSLEGGVAWYRKTFELDREEKRVYIHFDGIYRDCDIYLNEYFVGSHASGYSSFYFDITDFVNFGDKNVIAVRVDSSGREGWWYEGGGIYRRVWLETKENVHIKPWGVFAAPSVDLSDNSAEISVKTELVNRSVDETAVKVVSAVFDAEGNEVLSNVRDGSVAAWDCGVIEQSVKLGKARLWSLDDPYMYTLKTTVYADGEITDTAQTRFGVRHIHFDADSGFYLNGKNIKIKGFCCHHDHAGVGIAVPESVWEYRLARIKETGANAYRSAHHQPAGEVLDLCDKMGILMFCETRRMSSSNEDLECLRTLVRHARNHPSVFLWGIGNEEIFSQDRPETARTTVTMRAEINKLDTTRPVTSAVVCWNGAERFDTAENYIDVTKNLDIMGFNYCRQAWDDYHARMPKQPVIITEAATCNGTRGCYSTDESLGQYFVFDKDNAQKCKNGKKAVRAEELLQGEWKYCADRPYLSGIFLWTGMDYRGEPTPLAYPAVYSQFGVFDYCGFAKDNYYYYKSWWSNEDVLHIFPHWNWQGGGGERLTVYCYSNLDEVEIFVNGKSCGRKPMERNWFLSWEDVVYEPGELTAVGYRNAKEVMRDTVKTTGAVCKLELAPYKDEVSGHDTVIVNISAVDADGNVVPTADNLVKLTVGGTGEFLGCGNGNPADHMSEKAPARRLFNGLCQVLIRAKDKGEIKITAAAEGLPEEVCVIEVK